MKFRGAFSALVTPFQNGSFDEQSFRKLVSWQISEGIDGLVPCGTTGESATLSHEEHEKVILTCIDEAKGRVPIIAGAGSNNTSEAIRLTKFAKEAGADAALHITPYYNKPTQEGIYRHFASIAEQVDIPIFVYIVPGRTACNVLPSTMARLTKDIPTIVGVKEATSNLQQVSEIIESCPKDFCLLSGDDFTFFPSLALGGQGVISVVSNVAPKATAEVCKLWFKGDFEGAKAAHYKIQALCRALFLETNPIPVKTMLSMMNKMPLEFRLPICEASQENTAKIAQALKLFLEECNSSPS